MRLEVDATYQDGVLKPDQALPLVDGQRVKLALRPQGGWARASAGIFRWQGDPKDLEELLGPEKYD